MHSILSRSPFIGTPPDVSFTVEQLLSQWRTPPAIRLRNQIGTMRCVYIVCDDDLPLYIGLTNYGPRNRIRWHLYSKKSALGQAIRAGPTSRGWVVLAFAVPSRAEGQALESRLIEELSPKLNMRRGR